MSHLPLRGGRVEQEVNCGVEVLKGDLVPLRCGRVDQEVTCGVEVLRGPAFPRGVVA